MNQSNLRLLFPVVNRSALAYLKITTGFIHRSGLSYSTLNLFSGTPFLITPVALLVRIRLLV